MDAIQGMSRKMLLELHSEGRYKPEDFDVPLTELAWHD
jgi:hypothetical protein